MNTTSKICLGCQRENEESSDFCAFCGKELPDSVVKEENIKPILCPKCNAEKGAGDFCTFCGTLIEEIPAQMEELAAPTEEIPTLLEDHTHEPLPYERKYSKLF